MNIRDLKYVDAVARYLSFSKAALTCNVSQPALSNQIKKLENELGVTLFERGSCEIRLTKIGGQVVEAAQNILKESQRIHDLATEYRDPAALPLRVGMPPTLAPYLIKYLNDKLNSLLPQLQVILVEDDTDVLADMLVNRDIDIALVPRQCYEGKQEFSILFNEPLFIAVRKDHKLSTWEKIRFEEIPLDQFISLKYPLGFIGECEIKKMSSDRNQDQSFPITTTKLETLCRYISANDCCTIVPGLAMKQFQKEGWELSFIPLDEPEKVREIGIISRIGCPRKALLKAVCDEVYNDLPIGVLTAEKNLCVF